MTVQRYTYHGSAFVALPASDYDALAARLAEAERKLYVTSGDALKYGRELFNAKNEIRLLQQDEKAAVEYRRVLAERIDLLEGLLHRASDYLAFTGAGSGAVHHLRAEIADAIDANGKPTDSAVDAPNDGDLIVGGMAYDD